MADDELLRRIDAHMARGSEFMGEIRKEHQLNRAAVQSLRQVARELVLEIRENTRVLRSVDQGIQAQTRGLLHVLDELRPPDPPQREAPA